MLIPSEHNEPFKNRDPRKGPNNITGKSDADVDGVDMTINWSTDAGTLTSITALRQGRVRVRQSNDGGSYIDFEALPYGDDGRVDFVTLHFGPPPGPEDFNDDFFVNEKVAKTSTPSPRNCAGPPPWRAGCQLHGRRILHGGGHRARQEDAGPTCSSTSGTRASSPPSPSPITPPSVCSVRSPGTSARTLNLVAGLRYSYDEKEFSVERGNDGRLPRRALRGRQWQRSSISSPPVTTTTGTPGIPRSS